jgi:hypothetical protein
MAFTVFLSSDEANSHLYGNNDVYKLPVSGHLIVETHGGGDVYTYSAWIYLQADADHPAGRGEVRRTPSDYPLSRKPQGVCNAESGWRVRSDGGHGRRAATVTAGNRRPRWGALTVPASSRETW